MQFDRVVYPGDEVGVLSDPSPFRVGPGLFLDGTTILATKSGVLRLSHKVAFVDSDEKRYVALVGDNIIGVIEDEFVEHYKVSIGTHQPALLDKLAFEGATKRNRPQLAVGSLIYAKVLAGNKDMETELTCVAPDGKAAGMGELKDGHSFDLSLAEARALLRSDCPVLRELAKTCKFEMAVGVNGVVWVRAETTRNTCLIANCIQASFEIDPENVPKLVKQVMGRK
jgi:exosome complex component RRP40